MFAARQALLCSSYCAFSYALIPPFFWWLDCQKRASHFGTTWPRDQGTRDQGTRDQGPGTRDHARFSSLYMRTGCARMVTKLLHPYTMPVYVRQQEQSLENSYALFRGGGGELHFLCRKWLSTTQPLTRWSLTSWPRPWEETSSPTAASTWESTKKTEDTGPGDLERAGLNSATYEGWYGDSAT